MQKIKIIVNGAHGRMGQETVQAVQDDHELELVATCDHGDNLAEKIQQTNADVVVDFTTPAAVFENTRTIIAANAHPIIGTTGLIPEQITELQQFAFEKKCGGIIAPNFSIGAVLMMRFAAEAARYLPHAEIIEFHHDGKKDAPSGTAMKTAAMIAAERKENPVDPTEKELLPGARGGKQNNIAIHSIRLPGFVAHQEVIFGGKNETLTIRHDSIHRNAFMPGVIFACKKVLSLNELIYGLEKLL
jgi:4-hydroxy-tetrahydrodipicolinate reductase